MGLLPQVPSTRIRVFWNPQLFLSGHGFRLHVSGESRIRIRNFLNPLSWVEMLNTPWIRNRVEAKSGYFFIRWWNKIEPSSSPWKAEKDANFPRLTTHTLLPIFPEEFWVLECTRIPGYVSDSCGRANSIWILIRVDVEIFQFGKNKFQIEKHRDSCGRGLTLWVNERLRLTLF